MNHQDLSKLGRKDLLELLIEQNKKIDQLTEQLAQANQKLADRSIALEEAGSIAEAALQLNGVFEAAQNACTQYIDNLRHRSDETMSRCDAMEQKTKEECSRMIREAKQEADSYWRQSTNLFQSYVNRVLDHGPDSPALDQGMDSEAHEEE